MGEAEAVAGVWIPVAFPDRRLYGCTGCGSYNHTAGAIWCPLSVVIDSSPVRGED